jgi:hypothetical protein
LDSNSTLADIVIQLKNRRLLGENAYEVLKKAASNVPFELVERLRKKLTTHDTREKYPQSLKDFAMTLNFHSPKAYRFVNLFL